MSPAQFDREVSVNRSLYPPRPLFFANNARMADNHVTMRHNGRKGPKCSPRGYASVSTSVKAGEFEDRKDDKRLSLNCLVLMRLRLNRPLMLAAISMDGGDNTAKILRR